MKLFNYLEDLFNKKNFLSTFMESFSSELEIAIDSLKILFDKHNIDFIIIGGAATFLHGYHRTTEDVDIIIKRNDFDKLKNLPIGYIREISKGTFRRWKLTDTNSLYIEILVEGDKFKNSVIPSFSSIDNRDHLIDLMDLINLKLSAGRTQDLADIEGLIKVNNLSNTFIDNEIYLSCWNKANGE